MIVFFLFFFLNSLHSSSLVHSNLLTVILPRSIPFETSAVAWPTFELTIFRPPFNYFVRLYRHGSSLPFDFYPVTVLFALLSEHTFFFFFFEKNPRIPRFSVLINRLISALEVRASLVLAGRWCWIFFFFYPILFYYPFSILWS